jgi:hypothetical protein
MAVEPYASARRVYWVVDNASSHRGKAAAKRLRRSYRNARLVHLPVHASWLNLVFVNWPWPAWLERAAKVQVWGT